METKIKKNKFIPFKERGNLWADVEPIPQFSDQVEILKIDYSEKLRQINDFFRAILHKNEISMRAFDLTTELIEVFLYQLGFTYELYGMVPSKTLSR